MPGKGKTGWRSTNTVTPKKGTRKAAKKPQTLPMDSSPYHERLNDMDTTSHKEVTENSGLSGVMDLLIDISSHLEATEHGMDEFRAARSIAAPGHSQSLPTSQLQPC